MEILAILVFSGVLFGVMESAKKPSGKTPEEELGAALTKYLSKRDK